MPFAVPTLREVRALVRDNIRGNLPGADALIPNSVLRVLSDAMAATCHLTIQYIEWLSLQLMPDTAEAEWLDRFATIWLVNSDGSTGRQLAQLAEGAVTLTGAAPWTPVPIGTRLIFGTGATIVSYETLDQVVIATGGAPTLVRVRALDAGVNGNLAEGQRLSVVSPPTGVDSAATVVRIDGGVDEETDDELRARVLQRIREPPQGGAKSDYEQWALAVPGVTRVWVNPLEMGMGTTTVRFMMDNLRADRDGFPTQADVEAVRAYLDKVRPVAVKDLFVEAPIRWPVNVRIRLLDPDTPAIRAAIVVSLKRMFYERATPGQTIYAAWITHAIMDTLGVRSFDLVNCDVDNLMPSAGHLAQLGSVLFG